MSASSAARSSPFSLMHSPAGLCGSKKVDHAGGRLFLWVKLGECYAVWSNCDCHSLA